MKKTPKKKAIGGVSVIAPRAVPVARVAPVARVVPGGVIAKKGGSIKSKKC